jgi:hypothetical protein
MTKQTPTNNDPVDPVKAEQQRYYDALLIRGWRQFQNLTDVNNAFKSIFGIWPDKAGLLRTHQYSKVGVRHFTASRLPKINERLLNQDPEKDVLLLRKLQTSSYTTLKTAIPDKELNNESGNLRNRRLRMGFERTKLLGRNRDTDWNVCK